MQDMTIRDGRVNSKPGAAFAPALPVLAGFLFLWPGHPSFAAPQAHVLDTWLQMQTRLQTWTAEVTQIRSLKTLTRPLTAQGRVWFAAPDRIRWEMGDPATTIAVCQPEQMLLIYPPLRRVERYRWKGNQAGPWKEILALLEAGFPRTRSELENRFRILDQTLRDGQGIVVLQPRAPGARRMMPKMTIEVSTNDYFLRATQLEFADGSNLRNEFRHAQANTPLPPDLFTPLLDPEFHIVDPWDAPRRSPLP